MSKKNISSGYPPALKKAKAVAKSRSPTFNSLKRIVDRYIENNGCKMDYNYCDTMPYTCSMYEVSATGIKNSIPLLRDIIYDHNDQLYGYMDEDKVKEIIMKNIDKETISKVEEYIEKESACIVSKRYNCMIANLQESSKKDIEFLESYGFKRVNRYFGSHNCYIITLIKNGENN